MAHVETSQQSPPSQPHASMLHAGSQALLPHEASHDVGQHEPR